MVTREGLSLSRRSPWSLVRESFQFVTASDVSALKARVRSRWRAGGVCVAVGTGWKGGYGRGVVPNHGFLCSPAGKFSKETVDPACLQEIFPKMRKKGGKGKERKGKERKGKGGEGSEADAHYRF